jgi:ADP-heptose:LPS heptosyltransferase
MDAAPRILVIKLSALGDVVQSFGPIRAIRRHHPGAELVVLTTRPYAALFRACPDVNEVWIDERPKWHQPLRWFDLRRRLRGGGFARVYDLQTSDRSSAYFRLIGGGVEWSGIAPGCSHPHANPARDRMHTIERQAEQLRHAGIAETPFPDLSWLTADVSGFGLPADFALLVPGGAAHRPGKRWPAPRYAELANRLSARGVTPVLIGTRAEADAISEIAAAAPGAANLIGRTGFAELAALGRRTKGAVGNDTGPMHLLAVAGAPSLVLYARDSDPALCAQRGPRVKILRCDDLSALPVDEVEAGLAEIGGFPAEDC